MNQTQSDNSYGQTALSLGYATQTQVQECVQVQVKMRELGIDEPLGEIMVKKGYLVPQHHSAILKKLGVHVSPIPGYTLLSKIGQGGMGTVYKAIQTSVGRTVAIKIMSPSATKDKTYVSRFFQEAHAAGQLSHKNLITAIDVGAASGFYYFVMEYVTGKSSRELLNTQGPFDEKKALDIAAQMAEVLDHIHKHNLVHRDIKPENILLTPESVVKLCDLGLAKSTAPAEQSLTQEGLAVGTPYFMSPEQVRGDKDVDIRADLYSLGATLYFLVTGKHPYEGKSAAETMSLHLNAPVPDPQKAATHLTEDFAHVIRKLLAKERGERYQRPADLLDDLKKLQTGTAPHHARQHAARTHILHKAHSTQRALARRPAPSWPFMGAAAAVILITGVILALPSGSPPPATPKTTSSAATVPPKPKGEPAPAPAPEAPKDNPKRLDEAGRLFASADQLMKHDQCIEARAALLKLKTDYKDLAYTQKRLSDIAEMLGVCDEHVRGHEVAQTRQVEEARLALRERRWKDARPILLHLIKAGRNEFQKDLETCRRETEAETALDQIRSAWDKSSWAEIKSRAAEVEQRYGDTQTLARNRVELAGFRDGAALEQDTARLLAEAQAAAVAKRWNDVSKNLAEIEKRRDTAQTYRIKETDIKELKAKFDAATAQVIEDLAARAWTAALQSYDSSLQQKRYDEATQALNRFARDFAPTALCKAKANEIDTRVKAADAAKRRDHDDEARKLWAAAQKDFKTLNYDATLKSVDRLLTEFADSAVVKTNERPLRQFKEICEGRAGVPEGVIIAMDFEDFPGGWMTQGGAMAGNTNEPYQGKRAAKLTVSGQNSRAWHSIHGMTSRAETISFWARTLRKGPIVTVHFNLNDDSGAYYVDASIGSEWKEYKYKVASDFRSSIDGVKGGRRQINLDKVNQFGFSTVSNDNAMIEFLVDTLVVVEAKK